MNNPTTPISLKICAMQLLLLLLGAIALDGGRVFYGVMIASVLYWFAFLLFLNISQKPVSTVQAYFWSYGFSVPTVIIMLFS